MGSKATKSTVESSTEYYSRIYENYKNTEETNEKIPNNQFLIPEVSHEKIREQYMDPKSPSEQISRSLLKEFSVATLKLADLSIESLETDRPGIETPLKHHLVLDVERPSSNVEVQCWTPVVVRLQDSPDKELPAVIRNKNLEKVKNVVEVCSGAMKSTNQCRAPFGLRNRKEGKNNNIDKLIVSDKPRNQVNVGSKIPVFKGTKVKVRCEHISPRNMMSNNGSSKKTQWDPKD